MANNRNDILSNILKNCAASILSRRRVRTDRLFKITKLIDVMILSYVF